jgi:hypothetical protein
MNLHPAWWLLGLAALLGLAGLLWLAVGSIPWFGRLPGDIRYEGENVKFYFPIVTFLLLSIVLTIVMNIVARFWR